MIHHILQASRMFHKLPENALQASRMFYKVLGSSKNVLGQSFAVYRSRFAMFATTDVNESKQLIRK